MQIAKDPTSGLLKITGTLHVSEADDLRRALCEHLAQEAALHLDLSAVDACDTASLQLFYAARNTAIRRNKGFRVVTFSEAIVDTGKALGIPLELLTSEAGLNDSAKRGQDGAE